MMVFVALAALAIGCVEARRRWRLYESIAALHDQQVVRFLQDAEAADRAASACRERADILRRADGAIREQAADQGFDYAYDNDYTRQAGQWDRKAEEMSNQARRLRFQAVDHARKGTEYRCRWM
jgi:hypothetical protein